MYIIEPSKLNEYPMGKTKVTIFLLHPNFSNSSINKGKAASEDAVLKANKKQSKIALRSAKTLFPI